MAQDNKITNKEIEQFFKEISTAELTEDEIMKAFLDQFQERIENGDYAIEFTDEMKQELDAFVKKNDSKRRCEVAKELLEKKYNKEFEILRYRGDKFPEEYYSVEAYEKKHPSIPFEAWISNQEDEIQDSYVMKMVCESVRNKIIKNLDYFKGNMSVMVFSEELLTSLSNPDIGYEKIIEEVPNNRYSVHLYCNSECINHYLQYTDLRNMLRDLNGLKGSINIFQVNENEREKLIEYVNTHVKLYSSYWELADPYHKCFIRFEAGMIECSEQEYNQMLK